jgi:uncharacterized membrane protein YhaH (DUF805 family)
MLGVFFRVHDGGKPSQRAFCALILILILILIFILIFIFIFILILIFTQYDFD